MARSPLVWSAFGTRYILCVRTPPKSHAMPLSSWHLLSHLRCVKIISVVQPSILNGFSSSGLSSRKTFVVAVLVGGIAFVAISAGAREVRISAGQLPLMQGTRQIMLQTLRALKQGDLWLSKACSKWIKDVLLCCQMTCNYLSSLWRLKGINCVIVWIECGHITSHLHSRIFSCNQSPIPIKIIHIQTLNHQNPQRTN